jgi:glutathione S-transferase
MRLFWAPNTRSMRALWMLEEIGAPYERVRVDLKSGAQHRPDYHAINPMEKVPALQDGEACVAESGAIIAYLAEKFPQIGLAPPIGARTRGRFWQWLFFSGSCIEGAIAQKFTQTEMPEQVAGFGSFNKVFNVLEEVLSSTPYMLGEKFSAADVLIAADLHFTINAFKMLEPRPVFASYLERCQSRPAFLSAAKINSDGV